MERCKKYARGQCTDHIEEDFIRRHNTKKRPLQQHIELESKCMCEPLHLWLHTTVILYLPTVAPQAAIRQQSVKTLDAGSNPAVTPQQSLKTLDAGRKGARDGAWCRYLRGRRTLTILCRKENISRQGDGEERRGYQEVDNVKELQGGDRGMNIVKEQEGATGRKRGKMGGDHKRSSVREQEGCRKWSGGSAAGKEGCLRARTVAASGRSETASGRREPGTMRERVAREGREFICEGETHVGVDEEEGAEGQCEIGRDRG